MAKVKIELQSNGIRKLMSSEEVIEALEEKAKLVKNIAGEGYDISRYSGLSRANVSVYADTKKARQDNIENNTLLKALGSIRSK